MHCVIADAVACDLLLCLQAGAAAGLPAVPGAHSSIQLRTGASSIVQVRYSAAVLFCSALSNGIEGLLLLIWPAAA
jgi:ABC-type iron transport system FetAB permease component